MTEASSSTPHPGSEDQERSDRRQRLEEKLEARGGHPKVIVYDEKTGGFVEDPIRTLQNWRPDAYALMQEMARKQIAKGHDYSGADRDTFQNLRAAEELGLPAWKGVLVRMADKWRRLCNFARQGTLKVADETFEDTCIDLANYALFAVLMFRESHRKEAADE